VVATLLVTVGLAAALRGSGLAQDGRRTRLLSCAGFVAIYTAYLVAASLGTAFEPINSRYLSPVYVPLVVIAAAGLATVLQTTAHPMWRRIIGAAPAALLALQLVITADDARTGAVDGIGYNASGYVDSDLAAEAAQLVEGTDDTVLYSNLPFGLWAATRLQPIRWAPLDEGFRGAPIEGELDALAARVACAPTSSYLVRYRYGHPRVASLEQIRTAVDVRRVVVADDGAIFQLTPAAPAPCTDPAPRPTHRR
jgi:hypothetical protein